MISQNPLTFLVVDDHPDTCESIASMLTIDGHCVVTSYSALDAVALLAGSEFDVAIIDYQLGGNSTMSGIHVAKHARASTALVAMTGYDDAVIRRGAGEDWPFGRMLLKPVRMGDVTDLVAWVRRMSEDTDPGGAPC